MTIGNTTGLHREEEQVGGAFPTPIAEALDSGVSSANKERRRWRRATRVWILVTLIAFVAGSFGGYQLGFRRHAAMEEQAAHDARTEAAKLAQQVNPPEGYALKATFSDIGPQLIAAKAFRMEDFAAVYEKAGQPLTETQQEILTGGSNKPVVFTREDAYFLLNLLWALGLTNQSAILEKGPMASKGRDQVVNYASTGGWSLAALPVAKLYSSAPILKLTPDQEKLVEEVAIGVFRPCCDNPTHFPDCNHGMAMLGLLELMASQGAGREEMFTAAKYANAFWYPNQTLELAQFFKASQNTEFVKVDAKTLVSPVFSSGSGFQRVHQWLASNGQLQQAPGGGSSCGV